MNKDSEEQMRKLERAWQDQKIAEYIAALQDVRPIPDTVIAREGEECEELVLSETDFDYIIYFTFPEEIFDYIVQLANKWLVEVPGWDRSQRESLFRILSNRENRFGFQARFIRP